MSRASRGFRIAGILIRAISVSLVFGVIAFLLWRVFSSGIPKDIDKITVNSALAEAYEEGYGNIYMFKQNPQKTTTAERNKGFFTVADYVIIPEADQIQVVFRYTNGAIRSLVENGKLSETPNMDDELFSVSLSMMKDLTPENTEDNVGKDKSTVEYLRVYPDGEQTKRTQKNLYNYYRFVFDISESGASLSEMLDSGELLAVYFDIYFVGDLDADGKVPTDPETGKESGSYGTLMLYEYLADTERVFLSRAELNSIKNYKDE